MRKYTLKELKNLVKIGAASDITDFDFDQMNQFLHLHTLDKIGYSSGVYGINGGLMQDRNTSALYAITRRNGTLFMAF
mgnify:FL=1